MRSGYTINYEEIDPTMHNCVLVANYKASNEVVLYGFDYDDLVNEIKMEKANNSYPGNDVGVWKQKQ